MIGGGLYLGALCTYSTALIRRWINQDASQKSCKNQLFGARGRFNASPDYAKISSIYAS
jgi:hypothetical protein